MLFILACINTFAVIWILHGIIFRRRSFKLPPFLPGKIPIIGHVHWFYGYNTSNVWELYNTVSQKCTSFGGIVTFSLGLRDIYFVTDPEDAHTIANACNDKNFVYDMAKPWLGNGLLTSNGATWKSHRKIINPAFKQSILNSLIPVFNYQARRLVEDFNNQESTFNPEPLLLRNNLETICKTSLGLDVDKHQDLLHKYGHSLKELFEIMFNRYVQLWLHSDIIFYFTFLKKRHDKVINGLHNLSNTIIEDRKMEIKKHRQEQSSSDPFRPLLDTILELSMESGVFTKKEMREELDTILFGGHDTSATILTYILVLLGSDSSRQERAYSEILLVIGDSSRDVECEDLPKLCYLECIIKESLRLYPIAPAFPRAATKEVKTKHHVFPPGSCFLVDAWSIHRHPLWGPDAEKFKPERWQDSKNLTQFQKSFAGFGVGKRTCIGKTYAMMSLKVTLVHLLRRYKVTADISKLTLKMNSLLRPQSGHCITIEKRK